MAPSPPLQLLQFCMASSGTSLKREGDANVLLLQPTCTRHHKVTCGLVRGSEQKHSNGRVDAAQLAPSATPNGWNPLQIAGTETPSCVSSEHKGRDASAVQHERVHDVQDPCVASRRSAVCLSASVGCGSWLSGHV